MPTNSYGRWGGEGKVTCIREASDSGERNERNNIELSKYQICELVLYFQKVYNARMAKLVYLSFCFLDFCR